MLTEIKEELPKELKKEILILYELGLEDYEIEYILYLKTKERVSSKLKNKKINEELRSESSLKWRH